MFEWLSSSQEINYLLVLELQILGAQRVDGGNSFHTSKTVKNCEKLGKVRSSKTWSGGEFHSSINNQIIAFQNLNY